MVGGEGQVGDDWQAEGMRRTEEESRAEERGTRDWKVKGAGIKEREEKQQRCLE